MATAWRSDPPKNGSKRRTWAMATAWRSDPPKNGSKRRTWAMATAWRSDPPKNGSKRRTWAMATAWRWDPPKNGSAQERVHPEADRDRARRSLYDRSIARPAADELNARGVVGPLRFARYALAPNSLGYCGPLDHAALVEQTHALEVQDITGELLGGLRAAAAQFEGAWPYLELIAGANGIADPLDDRVVSAYWLGGPMLARVGAFATGNHVQKRFARRAGRWWSEVAAALEPGAWPSHAFHVMVVGPWVGMLRGGHLDAPLTVMDRCRIRRGSVLEVHGDEAIVRTDRVRFAQGTLSVGEPVVETVTLAEAGNRVCGPVMVGDTVAIHWHWVCEVLGPHDLKRLAQAEAHAIAGANRALALDGAPEPG